MRKLFFLLALLSSFAASSQIVYSPQHYAGGIQVDKRLLIPQDSTDHSGHIVWLNGVVYGRGLDGNFHALGLGGGGGATTIPWDSVTSKPTFAAVAFTGAFSSLAATPTTIQDYGIANGVRTDLVYNDPTWIGSVGWTEVTGFKADSVAAGFHSVGFYDARYSTAAGVTGANGITDSTHTLLLGGPVYKNTQVDAGTYNKQFWVRLFTKAATDSSQTSQFIVGDTNRVPVSLTSTFGNTIRNAGLIVSKKQANNGENVILLGMTTGDIAEPNGWLMQNYSDVIGQVQPRTVTYSNANTPLRHAYTHIAYMKSGTPADPSNSAFVLQALNYDSAKAGAPTNNRGLTRTTLLVIENGQRHALVLDSLSRLKIGDSTLAGSVGALGQLDLFNNGSPYSIVQRDATSKNKFNGPLLLNTPANAATGDFLLLRNSTDSTVKQLGLGAGLSVVSNNLVAAGSGGGAAAGASGSIQIKSATSGTFSNVPNFTADSVTRKVSADTMSAHTLRMDSAKLNYFKSWPFPNVLEGYGHSMMAGLSVFRYFYFNTVQPFPDSSFRNKFANRLSIPDYNHGYSGIGAMDAAMIGIKYQNPVNRALTVVMDGWNNIQNVTPVVPNTYNKIINSNKFLWVNGNLKTWKSAGSSDSVTAYGTWTAYTNTATAASPNAFLSVPLSETKSGSLSRQTTTINDSIVWTSPADSTVVIELLGWKLSGSTVQVFIDGVSKGTWNTNSQTDSVNTDIFVLGKVTYPLIFTGLPMTSHKVKVVNTTAGKLVVDFFGTLRDAKYSYPFIFVHDPDHGGTKANIVLNNGKQDSLVSTLQFMGYPAITFATNTYINAATDIAADSIHPNNSGHRHMDSGMSIVYLTHIPQGENGTLTFSNSLHVRNSDAAYGYRRIANTSDFNRFYGSIPDNLTQDQFINMNRHNVVFSDSGSGSFLRAPNLAIADSSSNTYIYLNARNRLTDNGFGIRIFSSAPSSIPDFVVIGGNGNNFGGSTTTTRQGATIALDTRGVTAPIRFLAHETGTVTDVVAGGIHGSGGWDIGGTDNLDSADTWMFFKPGTTTRSQIKLAPTTFPTSPKNGMLGWDGSQLLVRNRGLNVNLVNNHAGWQLITGGTAATVTNGINAVVFNPPSVIASYTLTLPPTPKDGDVVDVFFGGSIGANTPVVTSLSIVANAGQAIMETSAIVTASGGSHVTYKFYDAIGLWYRYP